MKQLKNNKLLLVAGLGLASMQIASAAPQGGGTTSVTNVLLMGYYAFDDTANTESAEFVATGLTSSVTKATASFSGAGSSDGYYGDANVYPLPNSPDGYLKLTDSYTVFTLTNNTSNDYSLATLLFDGFRNASGANGTVDYSYVIGTGTPVSGSGTVDKGVNDRSNFSDFSANLGLTLGAGQTFSLKFSSPDTFVILDNIAILGGDTGNASPGGSISAVPEPGSLVALGGVLVSGLALRSRRRSVKTA